MRRRSHDGAPRNSHWRTRRISPARQSARCELPEAEGVLRRVAHLVVVEIGKNVAALGAPSLDAVRPVAKRIVGVLRRIEAFGSMKAEVDEVARYRDVPGPSRRVADDQRDVVAPQERERVLAEPRRIARLDRVAPPTRRDHLEEPLRARFVELHSRGELDEYDRGLRPETRERSVGALDAVALDAQTLEMRDEAVELHRVDEIVGDGTAPLLEGLLLGLPVEGIVELDRVERPRVIVEPLRRREILRIEASLPVLVLPARCPDA